MTRGGVQELLSRQLTDAALIQHRMTLARAARKRVLEAHPDFATLRDHPRFQAILAGKSNPK